jgi:hypothetical protein
MFCCYTTFRCIPLQQSGGYRQARHSTPRSLQFPALTASPPHTSLQQATLQGMLSTVTSTNQPLQQQQLQSSTSTVPPALALGIPAHMQGYLQSGDNSSSQSPLTKSLEEGFVWVEPQFEPWPLAGNNASNQQQQYHGQQQQQQQQWYYSNQQQQQQQQQLQSEPSQRAQLQQQQQQQFTRSNSSGNAVLTPTVTASKRKSISSGTANSSSSSNNATAGAMIATATLVPLEALARCIHVVELFGKRAVLLAHLGDASVSTIYLSVMHSLCDTVQNVVAMLNYTKGCDVNIHLYTIEHV